VNAVVAVAAIVAAANLPQRVHQLRGYPMAARGTVGGGLVVAAVVLAAAATPLLDALDISAPNLQIGAAMVLGLWSIAAFFRWSDEPAPEPVAGGLVPGLFPIVLTPALGLMILAAGARNGFPAAVIGAAVVGGVLVDVGAIGRRSAAMASATAGVVLAVVVLVDGVLAI
jgi:hypothetical protein